MNTFIESALNIELFERAFQELPPNDYAYLSHGIADPDPQNVLIYSVLTQTRAERAIHFFMNQTEATGFILTL